MAVGLASKRKFVIDLVCLLVSASRLSRTKRTPEALSRRDTVVLSLSSLILVFTLQLLTAEFVRNLLITVLKTCVSVCACVLPFPSQLSFSLLLLTFPSSFNLLPSLPSFSLVSPPSPPLGGGEALSVTPGCLYVSISLCLYSLLSLLSFSLPFLSLSHSRGSKRALASWVYSSHPAVYSRRRINDE